MNARACARDFRNALRMTWSDSQVLLWVSLGMPVACGLFAKHLGTNFIVILLYLFPILASQKHVHRNGNSVDSSLEFSLTRAVSREALYAAQLVHLLALTSLLTLLLSLEALALRFPLPHLPFHLLLIVSLVSFCQATTLLLWPFPKAQKAISQTYISLTAVAVSFAPIWLDASLLTRPFFIPACLALIAVTQPLAYRAFLRQEIPS